MVVLNLRIRVVAAYRRDLGRLPLACAHLCTLGEVDYDRSRTTCACNVESTAYGPCYILGTTYLIAPLADRLSQTYEVDLLKSVSAKCAHAHLSGNDDNRCRVNHGIGNTCQSVGNARTACHQAHTYLTTNAREALSRMCSRLFMTHEYMVESFLLTSCIVVESIKHRHYRSAGIAEDGLYALVLERAHQGFCSCYLFHITISFLILFSLHPYLPSLRSVRMLAKPCSHGGRVSAAAADGLQVPRR